jgi:hypothetical protein
MGAKRDLVSAMTNADRARILAEARETLERVGRLLTKPYQPPPPADDDELAWPRDADTPRISLVSSDAMDAWRADAEVRQAAQDAADARRRREDQAREQQQVYVDQQSDVTELTKRLADLYETVSDLVDANAEHRARIAKLEAEQHAAELKHWTEHFARVGADKSKVIDLPALPLRRAS